MNEFAVEIDTKLAEAHKRLASASQKLEWATDVVRRRAGQKKDRNGVWNDSFLNARSVLEASDSAWVKRELDEYSTALANVNDVKAQVLALDAEYTGWSRFFLVTNSNGHIHRTMNCSTCYATTTFGWLPTLSGRTEAEAVAEQGEILCSVCFPSAPVAWTTGVSKASQEAAEARKAKSAAAAAKKAEKALGTVLRVGRWNDKIETIAAAKMWLTDQFQYATVNADETHRVATVLAERLGTTADAELLAASKRAANRVGHSESRKR